jgi:hypothetical protein
MREPLDERTPARACQGSASKTTQNDNVKHHETAQKASLSHHGQWPCRFCQPSPVELAERLLLRGFRLRVPKTARQVIRGRISDYYVFAALQRLEHRGLIAKCGTLPPVGDAPWDQPQSLWLLTGTGDAR